MAARKGKIGSVREPIPSVHCSNCELLAVFEIVCLLFFLFTVAYEHSEAFSTGAQHIRPDIWRGEQFTERGLMHTKKSNEYSVRNNIRQLHRREIIEHDMYLPELSGYASPSGLMALNARGYEICEPG